MNAPGGHQESAMPATLRGSPALEPTKDDGAVWQPSMHAAVRTSEYVRFMSHRTFNAGFR